MCNIAGYAGERDAAPVLVEMLRRQELYDGSLSTGVATIHEGKLYYKKVLGDVEEFLKQVDLSELPGSIGIAHSRPGNDFIENAHPSVSNNGKIAVVCNGTTADDFRVQARIGVANRLLDDGYTFPSEMELENARFPAMKNGKHVTLVEVIANQVEKYFKSGMCSEEALAKTCADVFGERVSVIINADTPDRICIGRQTRPIELLMGKGENYIATTRFAFPEDVKGTIMSLPPLQVCSVKKDEVCLSPYAIEGEIVDGVCEITPLVHMKAYKILEDYLLGKEKEPLVFDDLEFKLKDHPEIFHEQYDYMQHGKLVYDVLYQLTLERRLKSVVKTQETGSGPRRFYHMWID